MKHGDGPENEPEPSPEHAGREKEQEPLRLEAVDPGAGDPKGSEAGGQNSEECHRLGVDRTFGEFGHHDREK